MKLEEEVAGEETERNVKRSDDGELGRLVLELSYREPCDQEDMRV